MKLRVFIVAVLMGACAWVSEAGDLTGVKSVYLFPMANGLDQYLANRVTRGGIFDVVADPRSADAVFTDQLGAAFEARLDEVAPVKASAAEKEEAAKNEEKKSGEKEADAGSMGDTKATGAVPTTSFRRGKGMVFLVDMKTRRVLWSAYERPNGASSHEMDRTAGRLAKELKDALKPRSTPEKK